MPCVIAECETNQLTLNKNPKEEVKFIPFPITDYSNEQLRQLAKKRLYWWCRTCGVDFTTTSLNHLHVCSRHFFKGTCAQLWDIYNPDWIPSLCIPLGTAKRTFPSSEEKCEDFLESEQRIECSIANPRSNPFEGNTGPTTMRTELIDELIAYPIGRTYHLLMVDEEKLRNTPPYDVKSLPNTLKKCLTRTSSVGRMIFETDAPNCPERMFSGNSTITALDFTVKPKWETEKNIMKLQNSVLQLIALFDEAD